jgi:hypothetical protein
MLGDLKPWSGLRGWCHQCETWQFYKDARVLAPAWSGKPSRVCVNCDDEPWDWGVWPMDFCAEHAAEGDRLCREQVSEYPGINCRECTDLTMTARSVARGEDV